MVITTELIMRHGRDHGLFFFISIFKLFNDFSLPPFFPFHPCVEFVHSSWLLMMMKSDEWSDGKFPDVGDVYLKKCNEMAISLWRQQSMSYDPLNWSWAVVVQWWKLAQLAFSVNDFRPCSRPVLSLSNALTWNLLRIRNRMCRLLQYHFSYW